MNSSHKDFKNNVPLFAAWIKQSKPKKMELQFMFK